MSNNNFDEKKEYLLCKEKDIHNKRKKTSVNPTISDTK